MAELWGAETRKAVENFPVSGEPIPVAVVHWLGRIKAAAARVNADLGLLDADLAERIAAAADEVAAGEHDDQFPIDVFQTGSGTSSNMNANEVIATLAGEGVHPNDHVNMGQSSNDVFPSAVHLAALDRIVHDLLPALERLAAALAAKAEEFEDVVKSGRTHLMDAVPVTLGQEFGGYAAQMREGRARVGSTLARLARSRSAAPPIGNGLNTHPEFAARVRALLARDDRPRDPPARRSVRGPGQPRRPGRGVGRAARSVAVSLTKIANDLRWMGSGPRAGLGRDLPARAAEGQLDHARARSTRSSPRSCCQVAAQVIGNDAAITVGGLQGNFELNVQIPLMARNLLQSIGLLAAACRLLAERCVDGIEANVEQLRALTPRRTLAVATALNPLHRLRPGDGDRQGRRRVGPLAARGRPRARRRRRRCSTRRSTCARWRRGNQAKRRSAWTCSSSSTSRASRRASTRTCCASAARTCTGSSSTRASRCPTGRVRRDRRDGRADERERRRRAAVARPPRSG